MAPNGRFHLAGVMGMPVLHSLSPRLHGYWFQQHGLAGSYVPLGIAPDGLVAALEALPALGFSGCNITRPHKETAMAVMDTLDPVAKRIGAINCVVVGADGGLHGANNDGYGYIESIREVAPAWHADKGPIVVLGAGGGARAVVSALCDAGAREIRLINRTRARAEQLASDYGAPVAAHDWAARNDALEDAAMVVNTTNQGMAGEPKLEVSLARLSPHALVSDLIYNPKETPFLAEARARGNVTVNGLGMLLHQGVRAFKAWFGVQPTVTAELRDMMQGAIR
jgi:shikimate dehydrogenase